MIQKLASEILWVVSRGCEAGAGAGAMGDCVGLINIDPFDHQDFRMMQNLHILLKT